MDGGTCAIISHCCKDNREKVIDFWIYTILRRLEEVLCFASVQIDRSIRARARAAALTHKGSKHYEFSIKTTDVGL